MEEYRRGLIGQRAVHIDRKTVVAVHQSPLLDLTQRIEHLLGAAHRKDGMTTLPFRSSVRWSTAASSFTVSTGPLISCSRLP